MNYPTLVIILVVVVIVIVLIIRQVIKRRPAKEHNVYVPAASKAGKVAVRFARSNGFKVISPARIRGKNGVADLEAVVIGPFGILGVEGYGHYGNVYGTKDEKEWLNVTALGARTKFPNPILEAAADVRVIRDALFAKNIKMVPVEVISVFTSKELQLGVSRDAGHYTMKTYKAYIAKEKFLEEKNVNVEKAEEAIRAALDGASDAAETAQEKEKLK